MALRASYPPLSCRTSPPQGGRSDRGSGFPKQLGHCSLNTAENGRWSHLLLISPLEMSGRTEGSAPGTAPPKRRPR
ncbi:hypothetical protein CO659_28525 [Rhizobium sp. S9]|nr:hypothetical protein CO659_28525 [Rhizobium sp. S9]